MLEQAGLFAAFIVGLLGGVHCIGMCGGIVGALSFGLPQELRNQPRKVIPLLMGYNLGRIASYTLAGALMGGVGWLAANWLSVYKAQMFLQIAAAFFMLAMGLYLGGWWSGWARVEKVGGGIWKHIEPYAKTLLPIRRVPQAIALGAVWGWLPCGLVYSVLIWSLSAGSFQQGALLMLCFGLGTLPNLLAMGVFAVHVSRFLRQPWVRKCAGLVVIIFAVLSLWPVFQGA